MGLRFIVLRLRLIDCHRRSVLNAQYRQLCRTQPVQPINATMSQTQFAFLLQVIQQPDQLIRLDRYGVAVGVGVVSYADQFLNAC